MRCRVRSVANLVHLTGHLAGAFACCFSTVWPAVRWICGRSCTDADQARRLAVVRDAWHKRRRTVVSAPREARATAGIRRDEAEPAGHSARESVRSVADGTSRLRLALAWRRPSAHRTEGVRRPTLSAAPATLLAGTSRHLVWPPTAARTRIPHRACGTGAHRRAYRCAHRPPCRSGVARSATNTTRGARDPAACRRRRGRSASSKTVWKREPGRQAPSPGIGAQSHETA